MLNLLPQINQFKGFMLAPLEVILEVLLALLFLRPQIFLTRILSLLFVSFNMCIIDEFIKFYSISSKKDKKVE